MLVLGSIFGKGKQKPADKKGPPSKPFVATKDDPMKRLKEMSQDMYRELQKEFQQTPAEPPSRQTIPQAPVAVTKASEPPVRRSESRPSARERESLPTHEAPTGRLSLHGGQKGPYREPVTNIVPKTEADIVKGIIFSEILGPPKAKQ